MRRALTRKAELAHLSTCVPKQDLCSLVCLRQGSKQYNFGVLLS